MKWLMILFSLYVLTLSVVPCCGDDFCCDDEAVLMHEGASHKEHEHNKPELPCSPFFSCGMSHGAVVPDLLLIFNPQAATGESIRFNYAEHFYSEYYSAIWQPPQIA
jgi:hypothetical protein